MKRIVLASSNQGKIREIKEMMDGEFEVVAFTDLLGPMEIVEDGDSFKANAIIKAKTIYEKLNDPETIVISDDSGISVDALDGAPGIYSARYAGEGASDRDNLNKLVDSLKAKGLSTSPAHYTCAVSVASRYGIETVHGWMYGTAQTTPKGDKGFGYDPIFIPEGFDKTLGELESGIKQELSHRSKALKLAKLIIEEL